jgi:hypothetical protein
MFASDWGGGEVNSYVVRIPASALPRWARAL